jgi:hypothetical protein
MAGGSGFWTRVSGEVKQASERARDGARRAVQMGVLGVDLVSLRRDRTRARADLGQRAMAHWSAGTLDALEADAEALRIRSRIDSLEARIRDKESELSRLRAAAS